MTELAAPTGGPTPRVVVVPDPAAEAEAYARRLGADVADDHASMTAAVTARTAATQALGETSSDGLLGDDGDLEDLAARATSIRAVAAAEPVTEADLDRLRIVAAEVARAERIRTHTERRFRERAEAAGVVDDDPTSSPTVVAVAAFHRKAQARWRVQWAAVGGGEPPDPEPDALDLALEGLAGRRRRAIADLDRLERFERRAAASAVLARPLVVVEPSQWIAADELGRLLGSLAPAAQVIVLERRSGAAGAS